MSRTCYCDSAGIRTLTGAHQRARAEGGNLLLVVTAAPVLRVLALLGIDRIIPAFPSLEQALAQAIAPPPAAAARH